jgi:hypothetical protein
MKLRWILPPLAALSVVGVVWVSRHGNAVTAETLLANAREHLEGKERDPRLALRELDEALRLVDREREVELNHAILTQRSLLYRTQGLTELALGDCKAALSAHGPDVETLIRANDLALQLGDSGLALEYARALEPLDPAAAESRIGRCQVALADVPLAALEAHARSVLTGPEAQAAIRLAQRAAVFAGDPGTHSAALEELTDLFATADDRRRVFEWVSEASERLDSARTSFVRSLAPGSSADAVAGLQDLFLRGGAEVDAVELGMLALTRPGLANAMPILARTASALEHLALADTARALILDQRKRNAPALRPQLLPSHALRDELVEWCFLLERLEMWAELRTAAGELQQRAGLRGHRENVELAQFLGGLAALRLNDLRGANRAFSALGGNPLEQHDIPTRVWLARAELGRRQKQAAQERYALLLATRAAPRDPAPALRRELGQGWLRLSELRQGEGELLQALECMTHALRLLPERFAELEPLWTELGKRSFSARGKNVYAQYLHASTALERKEYANALTSAQYILGEYPGLGPVLEIFSKASFRLHDYARTVTSSLEVIERGWAPEQASARLRAVPEAYFLPADRLRWMRSAPRASVVPILEHLRARGDLAGAARAARTANLQFQPPEDVVRLARAQYEAGLASVAQETLAFLPPKSPVLAESAGLVLLVAATHALQRGALEDFVKARTAVLASGRARDPELIEVLDLMLATGRAEEAAPLVAWLVDSAPDFLPEALLRAAVHELVTRAAGASGDAAERAEALLEDGRAGVARLLLASERGDAEELAREAAELLAGPLAEDPGLRAACLVLAGDGDGAAAELALLPGDGRAPLAELALSVLAELNPASLARGDGAPLAVEPLPAELLAAFPPARLLVLALAAHTTPWAAWTLARTAHDELGAQPWLRLLRARAAGTLGLPELGLRELGQDLAPLGARGAWLAARLLENAGAPSAEVLARELDWLRAAGARAEGLASATALRARLARADGRLDDAVALLEEALRSNPRASDERLLLAELEGQRQHHARAAELLTEEHAARSREEGAELLLPLLAALRAARDAGQSSEARWWTEVEALEAEHPRDPAPMRELAQRAFEHSTSDGTPSALRAAEMLARLRERTLGRSLESLRAGEGLRWVRLFARYSPSRALALAREELELTPLEPELWRALAEAELAVGDWTGALATLEAIHSVAPERETARLLTLTAFHLDSDAHMFLRRLGQLEKMDEGARTDPLLVFYRRMAELRLPPEEAPPAPENGAELWGDLAKAGLAEARLGRAFAIALFESGKRTPALTILGVARGGAESALERDLFEATAHLMKAAPEKPRVLSPEKPPAPATDKAATQKKPAAGAAKNPKKAAAPDGK